jgi:chemotaxis signal transduction protein
MKNSDLEQSDRFCVFQSGENWFAMPSLAIRGVVPERMVARMPHSDPVLSGICYVQNEFIPVVSLRALLSVEYEAPQNANRQLMILLGSHGPWGLSIDRAVALVPLETSYSTYSNLDDSWSRVVVGSAKYSTHVVQVLDPNAMYQYAARLLDMFWQDHGRIDTDKPTTLLESNPCELIN